MGRAAYFTTTTAGSQYQAAWSTSASKSGGGATRWVQAWTLTNPWHRPISLHVAQAGQGRTSLHDDDRLSGLVPYKCDRIDSVWTTWPVVLADVPEDAFSKEVRAGCRKRIPDQVLELVVPNAQIRIVHRSYQGFRRNGLGLTDNPYALRWP